MAFDLKTYLEKYRQDHQHPVNKALHTVGIPTIIASLAVVPFNPLLGASMFVFGWVLQFVGHAFEGKAPSFFSDPKFLLVGAAWFLKKVTGRADGAPDASAN
jgi:uncharacterized membrane protein YGL010W